MKKYLHYYDNKEDLYANYDGKGIMVTAVTVNGARIYQSCYGDTVLTHDYDGKYVFDREIEVTDATDCNGDPITALTKVRIYKNGNKEVMGEYYSDFDDWSDEGGGWLGITQDFSHCGQAGDGYVESEDFFVEYGYVSPYYEPWVSYTTYIEPAHTKSTTIYYSVQAEIPYQLPVGEDVVLTLMHEVDITIEYCT